MSISILSIYVDIVILLDCIKSSATFSDSLFFFFWFLSMLPLCERCMPFLLTHNHILTLKVKDIKWIVCGYILQILMKKTLLTELEITFQFQHYLTSTKECGMPENILMNISFWGKIWYILCLCQIKLKSNWKVWYILPTIKEEAAFMLKHGQNLKISHNCHILVKFILFCKQILFQYFIRSY